MHGPGKFFSFLASIWLQLLKSNTVVCQLLYTIIFAETVVCTEQRQAKCRGFLPFLLEFKVSSSTINTSCLNAHLLGRHFRQQQSTQMLQHLLNCNGRMLHVLISKGNTKNYHNFHCCNWNSWIFVSNFSELALVEKETGVVCWYACHLHLTKILRYTKRYC